MDYVSRELLHSPCRIIYVKWRYLVLLWLLMTHQWDLQEALHYDCNHTQWQFCKQLYALYWVAPDRHVKDKSNFFQSDSLCRLITNCSQMHNIFFHQGLKNSEERVQPRKQESIRVTYNTTSYKNAVRIVQPQCLALSCK